GNPRGNGQNRRSDYERRRDHDCGIRGIHLWELPGGQDARIYVGGSRAHRRNPGSHCDWTGAASGCRRLELVAWRACRYTRRTSEQRWRMMQIDTRSSTPFRTRPFWAAGLEARRANSRIQHTADCLAEREGFEPPIPFRVCRFSRPEPSTTRPPLRCYSFTTVSILWQGAMNASYRSGSQRPREM